eukprot:jgi/Tetstr1/423469/TSEL_014150.t1
MAEPHPSTAPPSADTGAPSRPRKAYRWKGTLTWRPPAAAEPADEPGGHFSSWPTFCAYRRVHLPQALGIGEDGLWRWPLLSVELDVGARGELGRNGDGECVVALEPVVRLKTAAWQRKFGVVGEVQVLPTTHVKLQKRARMRLGILSLCCSSQAGSLVPGTLELRLATPSWHGSELQLGDRVAAAAGDGEPPGGGPLVRLKRRLQPRKGCWLGIAAERQALSQRPVRLGPGGPAPELPLNREADKAEGAGLGSPHAQRPPWEGGFPLSGVSLSVALLGDRFGRDVQSLDIIGAETQRWQLQGRRRARRGWKETPRIGVVAGHWIDPGADTGAPGEREFNMEVANAVDKQLTSQGWRVYRPDRDTEGLAWDDYLRWVARQSRRGTPVVEIHGQGRAAAIDGIATGVIGCRGAPLNRALGSTFGFFPMDWTGLAGEQRGKVAQQLGGRISEAVRKASVQVRLDPLAVESGCSQTGCPIGKYGHALDAEADERDMLAPSHPLALSPALKESLGHKEAPGPANPGSLGK